MTIGLTRSHDDTRFLTTFTKNFINKIWTILIK